MITNLLKSWGLSEHWWQGKRGEYWALGQGILSFGFILLPRSPLPHLLNILSFINGNFASENFVNGDFLNGDWVSKGLTIVFGLGAIVLLGGGLFSLGSNLTPLPHPKEEGELVTTGIYGIVRHPIYSGVIFLSLAYGCWLWSWPHLLGGLGFILFFDAKARQEEAWLGQKFPDYDRYRQQVKKLIPGIY